VALSAGCTSKGVFLVPSLKIWAQTGSEMNYGTVESRQVTPLGREMQRVCIVVFVGPKQHSK
jgi:hypothetical protein